MDNIPSLLGNNGSRKTKPPRAVEATVLSLKTTQNLEVVRANAADSDVQAMKVSDQQNFSEVRGKADSPADHDTADQECYTSDSTGFMVTGS